MIGFLDRFHQGKKRNCSIFGFFFLKKKKQCAWKSRESSGLILWSVPSFKKKRKNSKKKKEKKSKYM